MLQLLTLLYIFSPLASLQLRLNDCFICCKYHVFLVFIVFHENTSSAQKNSFPMSVLR